MREYHKWIRNHLENTISDIDDEHSSDSGIIKKLKWIIKHYESMRDSDKSVEEYIYKEEVLKREGINNKNENLISNRYILLLKVIVFIETISFISLMLISNINILNLFLSMLLFTYVMLILLSKKVRLLITRIY